MTCFSIFIIAQSKQERSVRGSCELRHRPAGDARSSTAPARAHIGQEGLQAPGGRGLIAEPVVGPLWRQGGGAERTTPAEIEEVLARVGDRVASRTPLTWDQVTRVIFYNDYPDNRATLAPIPDDAFARAWTMVVTPDGRTTALVPIDLYTAATLGPPLPVGGARARGGAHG